jgi:hypothetical protein
MENGEYILIGMGLFYFLHKKKYINIKKIKLFGILSY